MNEEGVMQSFVSMFLFVGAVGLGLWAIRMDGVDQTSVTDPTDEPQSKA